MGAVDNYLSQAPQTLAQQTAGTLNKVAPLANIYTAPNEGMSAPQRLPAAPAAGTGFLSGIGNFFSSIGHETGNLAVGAAKWLGTNALNMVEAPLHYAQGISAGISDNMDINRLTAQTQQQSQQLQTLVGDYKAGRLTQKQYQLGMKELSANGNQLVQMSSSLVNRTSQDQQAAYKATVDTAGALVTILTAGFGSAAGATTTAAIGTDGLAQIPGVGIKAASDYLTSTNANAFLGNVEQGLTKLVANPELFIKLTPEAQKAIQTATSEVIAQNTGAMTAAQITRASAANIALKYPIYFNMLSSTGQQLYTELDNRKYGAAVQTLAFNAALLLSGGPIGQALKALKGGAASLGARAFQQSPFFDELSKYVGTKADPAGIYKAVSSLKGSEALSNYKFNILGEMVSLPPADALKRIMQNLSSVEAVNMAAVGGKDFVSAAKRVAEGMASYEGAGLNTFTHDELLMNMNNFAEAQRFADGVAKANGLGSITVGRVDQKALGGIAGKLVPTFDTNSRQSAQEAWQLLREQNPTQAWALNGNFDKQITEIINKVSSAEELNAAIKKINVGFEAAGFPKKAARQLAAMGYIPIAPNKLEAPFKEGSGAVYSAFATGKNDLFVKAVQPLPVLSQLGDMLTRMGMSPNAATERVYTFFNQHVAENLASAGVVFKGKDAQQESDTLIKQLSDYAHEPTAGKVFSKMPISDLRMLTKKDIMTATGQTAADAVATQKAIAHAWLQVPLEFRGLGDRAVDLTYAAPGASVISRRFLRAQGALRFAWNPFFQYLRVIPKTEILATTEGAGYLSSIFGGHYNDINPIRDMLRSAGMLDEHGSLGNVISGEAVDFLGASSRNLSKKLLPMQERSIAGLVASQADRMGMTWQDYIQNQPNAVADTIQAIAQYDRRANFLNSPMMRTLNIAFFPARFDYKVASIFANRLAQTSLINQVAVVHGLMSMHTWLNSPEGQVWYSKNSTAIGIFKYITPVASLSEAFQSLLPGQDHSLGNFGELGGLPFGWLPMILDAEGLTHFSQTGVNPKTGDPFPSYIPTTTRGQAAIAVQDLIGSVFSYPGATVGLPSKTSITRNTAMGITGASKKKDMQLVTPSLNPEQQQYQQTIHAVNPTTQGTPLTAIQNYTQTDATNVNAPVPAAPQRAGKAPKAAAKKKSQYIPVPINQQP